MKSKQRQEMADLAKRRFDRMKNDRQERAEDRTGHENLKLILGMGGEPARVEPEPEAKPQIVLYLKDSVNPAEKNFTKYPNEIHDLKAENLTEYEDVVYTKLWRESFGYGKNHCRIAYNTILKQTSLRSLSTVRRAVAGLKEKQFIILVLDENEEADTTKEGTLYRVCMPSELYKREVEEGVSLDDIPRSGVFCVNMVRENIIENPDNTSVKNSMVTGNMVTENTAPTEHGQHEHSSMSSQNMVAENIGDQNIMDTASSEGVLTEHGQREHLLKEDSLKTLSLDPVLAFYTGIGQTKISKLKREKGNKVLQELEADGFSLENIQFAVKWTIKNAKEKPYDFSLLKDTIGQAISARHTEEQAAHKAREEKARVSAEEEEQRRLEGEFEKTLAEMTKKERAELEKQARAELSGVSQEFITDMSIRGKMKEIFSRDL